MGKRNEVYCNGCLTLLISALFLLNSAACSSSDSTSPNQSSTGSFASIPISSVFFSDTTVMVEVLVFNKMEIGQSTLEERIQIDTSNLSENARGALLEISIDAAVHIGVIAPDGITELRQIRPCSDLSIEAEFNLVLTSTDSNGDTVKIVNADVCGSIPGFGFEDIDGETDRDLIGTLLFGVGSPIYQDLLQ